MFVTVLSSNLDVNLSYALGPCLLLVVVLVILLSWIVYVCVWFVFFDVTVVMCVCVCVCVCLWTLFAFLKGGRWCLAFKCHWCSLNAGITLKAFDLLDRRNWTLFLMWFSVFISLTFFFSSFCGCWFFSQFFCVPGGLLSSPNLMCNTWMWINGYASVYCNITYFDVWKKEKQKNDVAINKTKKEAR